MSKKRFNIVHKCRENFWTVIQPALVLVPYTVSGNFFYEFSFPFALLGVAFTQQNNAMDFSQPHNNTIHCKKK